MPDDRTLARNRNSTRAESILYVYHLSKKKKKGGGGGKAWQDLVENANRQNGRKRPSLTLRKTELGNLVVGYMSQMAHGRKRPSLTLRKTELENLVVGYMSQMPRPSLARRQTGWGFIAKQIATGMHEAGAACTVLTSTLTAGNGSRNTRSSLDFLEKQQQLNHKCSHPHRFSEAATEIEERKGKPRLLTCGCVLPPSLKIVADRSTYTDMLESRVMTDQLVKRLKSQRKCKRFRKFHQLSLQEDSVRKKDKTNKQKKDNRKHSRKKREDK